MPEPFVPRFVHVGVAVPDLEAAIRFYTEAFGHVLVRGPYEDPIQQAKVAFLAPSGASGESLELVAPLAPGSHVERWVKRQAGAYHSCYEVESLESALDSLRASGCVVVAEPAPAVAFGGRRIAWIYTPVRALVELLERGPSASA